MIRFFWRYRYYNLAVIFFCFIFCIFSFDNIKVYFDSERIIELVDVDQDIIDKAIDDRDLLLVGIELKDSFSFPLALEVQSTIDTINTSQYIRSVRSVLNERILLNQLIPIPIRLLKLNDQDDFIHSLERVKKHKSRFISTDFQKLLFIIKCKDLDTEQKSIDLLDFLNNRFSNLPLKDINITGQVKSEIYMKKNIVEELILFIICSAFICSLILFYFLRNSKLIVICMLSIFLSIIFSFSVSNFMFGGVELVMIIIPAIIFIINISDYMHLLNIQKDIKSRYKLFCLQLTNIGKPVFLTSVTTAIGFLSFTFGSFEPLMRFGVVTTLSIFISLFIIVTFFALVIEFNILSVNANTLNKVRIHHFVDLLSPYKKWFLGLFIVFSAIGVWRFEVDNYLTDELNHSSLLYKEISFIEKNFGGIKPLSFSLVDSLNDNIEDHINFLKSKDINVDIVFNKKDTTLIKTRIKDIGALRSNILYTDINRYSQYHDINLTVGGIGYLFDKISNNLTYEVLIGLLLAIFLIGIIFVFINKINFKYLIVSLIPNLLPLFSCLGIFSLFGFYLSLSNAFIFAIVFGLIVDDSVHIISAYSINRARNRSVNESIRHCRDNTFHAVIKTTLVIVASLIPLLFSQFTSISQLASITITAAIIALIFDVLLLPILLERYIK